MGQISYNQINFNSNGNNSTNKVGFFSLKNDNDEAVVRIMHDSVTDFDILEVHPIQINGKFLKANCIRDAREPIEKCPLCAAGYKIQQRVFVHLVQYTIENGQIVATPRIWDRPISFATELKSKMDMYGPLSEQLFVIKRHGAAGDLKTTYSIDYAPPMVYQYDQYAKRPELFEGYTTIGNAVISKDYNELQYFLETGTFPSKQTSENPAGIPVTQPTYQQPVAQPVQQPAYQTPTPQPVFQANNDVPPWDETPFNNPNFGTQPVQQQPTQNQRPVRYY